MIKARILLIFAALAWGTSFAASKICLQYLTPIELMAFRFWIGLPILLILMIAGRVKFNPGVNRWGLASASLIIMLHFLIQITGIKYTTATNTGWIISVTPLVVAALAFLILRERISIQAVLGIVLAAIGVLLLISKGRIASFSWLKSIGDWLVLASAFTWAFYTIIIRNISRRIDPLLVTFMVLIPSAVLSLAITSFSSDWKYFLNLPLEAYLSLLYLGIIGTAIGHWFWQKGVAELGASKAGIFLYLEPIATTAVAVPYLHESFGVFSALGGLLVLLGVWIGGQKAR